MRRLSLTDCHRLFRYWGGHPPLHELAAAYLQYSPAGRSAPRGSVASSSGSVQQTDPRQAMAELSSIGAVCAKPTERLPDHYRKAFEKMKCPSQTPN